MNQFENNNRVSLIILDGWGYSLNWAGNAVNHANPQCFNKLWNSYGHKLLRTYNPEVPFSYDLLKSEVCHTQISAGRFIKGEHELISDEIRNKKHLENEALNEAYEYVVKNDSKMHLICPIDENDSSLEYVQAILEVSKNFHDIPVFLHIIATKSYKLNGLNSAIKRLSEIVAAYPNVRISSLMGSKFTSSRPNEFEYAIQGYDAIINGNGKRYLDISQILNSDANLHLEASEVDPGVIVENGKAIGRVHDFDCIIFSSVSNEIVLSLFGLLVNESNVNGSQKKFNLKLYAFSDYLCSDKLNYTVIFKSTRITPNLTELLSMNRIPQIHIAESAKEDNVGFYFDGRRSARSKDEKVMVVSSQISSQKQNPKMSAEYIAKVAIDQMIKNKEYFLLINFANADYFAHTKDINATSEAVKAIDHCLSMIYETAKRSNATMIITADHGNAESMASGSDIITAGEHSKNPVPFILISEQSLKQGDTTGQRFNQINFNGVISSKDTICDIAPTILDLYGIKKPSEFIGNSLLNILE